MEIAKTKITLKKSTSTFEITSLKITAKFLKQMLEEMDKTKTNHFITEYQGDSMFGGFYYDIHDIRSAYNIVSALCDSKHICFLTFES